eukprot:2765948-Amphidinium_carterae.2
MVLPIRFSSADALDCLSSAMQPEGTDQLLGNLKELARGETEHGSHYVSASISKELRRSATSSARLMMAPWQGCCLRAVGKRAPKVVPCCVCIQR